LVDLSRGVESVPQYRLFRASEAGGGEGGLNRHSGVMGNEQA
jgi:hypothetical protein